MSKSVKVYFEKLRDDVILPEYKNDGDAGMDVYLPDEIVIDGGEVVLIPLGFKISLPENYEMQVRPRSGLSLKTPLRIPNSPGTVDKNYIDEVCVIMENISESSIRLSKGERIAQLVLNKVPLCVWEVVDSVKEISSGDRGGGFGSTGS